MRKSLLLLFLVAFCTWSSFGAVATSYQFAQGTAAYTPITGGTLLGSGTIDDTSYPNNPIGFTFNFNGTNYTAFSVNCNGFLALGTSISSSYTPISSGSTNNIVSALGDDLQGNAGGALQYQTIGTAPNRVLVVQWSDFRNYAGTQTFNFQIRLSETSNKVTIHYGTFAYPSGTDTKQVGIRGGSSADYLNRSTATDWSATTAGTLNSATCTTSTTVLPASGLYFEYSYLPPAVAGVVSPTNGQIDVPRNTTLNWAAGTGAGGPATGYKVYLGTDNPPTNLVNGTDVGSATTFDPNPDLIATTTYYWRIDAYGPGGNTTGTVWSFTTLTPSLISGWVRNSALNPIIGAEVFAGVYSTTTGAGGAYSLELVPGTYDMVVQALGYNPGSATGVVVQFAQTTTVNFTLTNPTMSITPNPFDVTVNPEEYYTQNMYILNEGTGVLNWDATVTYPPGDNAAGNYQAPVYPIGTGGEETSRAGFANDQPLAIDAMGDVLDNFLVPSSIVLPWGIGTDNGDIMVTDPSGNPTKIFRLSTDGTLLGSITCSLGGSWIGDMAPGPAGSVYAVCVGGSNAIYQVNS
ncbi:MAG TPA: Ig-like domain-containing protein, partial [Bacteroidales bacterium]|nr:Ig-like domain-containing protein [Bacteroidales bacterium]